MSILYSIPSKASKNNGTLRCTIPREIVAYMDINPGDKIIWKLLSTKKLEVEIRKK